MHFFEKVKIISSDATGYSFSKLSETHGKACYQLSEKKRSKEKIGEVFRHLGNAGEKSSKG